MLTDAHATGEGYLRSPLDGSLRDIVSTTLQLERAAGVTVERRLGVSLASALLARDLGDTAEWGGEWLETEPAGPQGWWPVAACDDRLLRGLSSIGMRWLCVGATAGAHAERVLLAAREIGLSVALRPSLAAVEAIEGRGAAGTTFESLPMLLDVLIARETGREPCDSVSDGLRGIAAAPDAAVDAAVRWIADAEVTVTPLLTAASRQASLRAIVRAPHLADAARVLPYHERVASLRSPGAMRMGGKEASAHLGVPILDKHGEREASAGLRRSVDALRSLIAAGGRVRVGSGAPGAGLAPGSAAQEEAALVAEASQAMEVSHG